MKDTIYLIISRATVVRMRKTPGGLGRGEIAVKVNVKADDELFKQPIIARDLIVTEDSVVKGKAEIEAEGLSMEEHKKAIETMDGETLDELVNRGFMKREWDKDQGFYYVIVVKKTETGE